MTTNRALAHEDMSSDPRRYLHRQLTMPVLLFIGVLLCYGTLSGSSAGPWASIGVVGLAAGLCLWRGFMLRSERAGWLLMAAALTSFTAGQVYLALVAPAVGEAFPSPADIGHLGFYPLACAALWALARGRTSTPGNRRFDALASFVTVAALAAAVVVGPLVKMPYRSPLAVGVALA
jgi:hypothetical protein